MSDALLDDVRPGVGARRQEVLDRLRRAGAAVTAAEVAHEAGMHLNTARFHLDGLVEQGYVVRRTEQRRTPGRPRVLYSVSPARPGPRGYRQLSQVLAGIVAALDPDGGAAAEAGRSWGRDLAAGTPPTDDPVARLHQVMDEAGFAPETIAERGEVRLHHCPFLEVATDHADVVCRMHLGLMRGALEETGAGLEVRQLVPFATPQVCVAHLAGKGQERPSTTSPNEGAS